MTDQGEVWVLSAGSYSDYRVKCVVEGGKAAAELLASRANAGSSYDYYYVESLPVVTADVQRVEVLSMFVNLWDDGTETEERLMHRVEWPFDLLYEDDAKPVHWRWVRAPIHRDKGGRLEVAGTDHERVRKVFGDQRAMFKSDDTMRARREAKG